MPEISLLLGAGFSANKGYPTVNSLNSKILNLKAEQISVGSEGTLFFLKPDEDDPFLYSHYNTYKQFTLAFINYYHSRHTFDYEEFYDYYMGLFQKKITDPLFNEFCDSFRASHFEETDNHNLLLQHNHIFNQIICELLVDEDGFKFYPPAHSCKPIYPGYSGFLNCLEGWGYNNIVHVHSLNHDLLFETFNHSDWLQGNLTDGFEELGSPFYGDLQERFKIRLPYFANKFNSTFRYYKLHGSIDQYPFHLVNKGIDTYIKIKPGINNTSLYKEIRDENNNLIYINDFLNYHSDFLSGTTSKILRYREPLYYEIVFRHFEINLTNSQMLIIIGYGCKDKEINNLIKKFFNRKQNIYLVDPFPQANILSFCKELNAKLIVKTPDNLLASDFN